MCSLSIIQKMDPSEFNLSATSSVYYEDEFACLPTKKNKNCDDNINFTTTSNTLCHSIGKQKSTLVSAKNASDVIVTADVKNKPIEVDPDAFDIEPLRKIENDSESNYSKRRKKILSPVNRIPSCGISIDPDSQKKNQFYRKCHTELIVQIPKNNSKKSVINIYRECEKNSVPKRCVDLNNDNYPHTKRPSSLSSDNVVCVTSHKTTGIRDENIVLGQKENVVLKQDFIELERSKCKPNTISSKVPVTAVVESSCALNNKPRLFSERNSTPELLAEQVGWNWNPPLPTKKCVIKFNKIKAVSEKKKHVPNECLISTATLGDDNDEGNKVSNESINSTLKKLNTPTKTSNNISGLSSGTNSSVLLLKMEIISENVALSSESPYQNSLEEVVRTKSRSQTRIGSSKSPRISRVIGTEMFNNTTEVTEQSSGISTTEKHTEKSRKEMQCDLTEDLSVKLARVRANFKYESKRKLQTKSKIRYQVYSKRRKSETKLNLSSVSDTDQESHITVSTMDEDKSKNDVINMNESSATEESEVRSTFSVLSRSNVENGKQRIPFIMSPTTEVESDSSSGQNWDVKRKLQKMHNTNSGMSDHREKSTIIDATVVNESQVTGYCSIDSGISDFEASPVRPSCPTEGDELSKEIDNDQAVDLNFQPMDNLYAKRMESVNEVNSSNLDIILRLQTGNHKILDNILCAALESPDNEIKNLNVSKVSSQFIPDPLSSGEKDEKSLVNSSSRVNDVVISKSIDAKLLNNRPPLSNQTSSLIEKDNCNQNKDKNCDVQKKTMRQKAVNDTKLLTITDENSKSKVNGYSSKITSISTSDTIENIMLNQNKTEEIAAMLNLHLKKHESAQVNETFQQKDEIVSNKTTLPLKKRPTIIATSTIIDDSIQKTITKGVSVAELPLASPSQTVNCELMNRSTVITPVRQLLVGEVLSTRNNEMNDQSDTYGTKDSEKLNLSNTDKLNDTIDQPSTVTNNTDSKKVSKSLQSSASTPICLLKSTEFVPKWHSVTSAVTVNQVANGNVLKVPLTQNLHSAPILQVLSSPSVSNQSQSLASSDVPMQVQLQIQPSIPNQFQSQLFLNLAPTTSERSNLIVTDNIIPSLVQYPIGILSHIQQMNKPQVTSNNPTITSIPKQISPQVVLLKTSVNSESLPSTCSLPVPSISVIVSSASPISTSSPSIPLSSLNQAVHPPLNQTELPLNNQKIINQQSIPLPILECNVNNRAHVNVCEQNISVYLNVIIVNILKVRECLHSWLDMKITTNQAKTLTSQQSLRVRYSSLIDHIISSYLSLMTIVRNFQRHITIYDMFNETVTYSSKIGTALPPITLQEINNIYFDYLRKHYQQSSRNSNQNAQMNSQLLNTQTQNTATVSYAYNHPILPPYSNVNNSFPQNFQRMQSPQPVPPPTCPITYGYSEMTGKSQTPLNRIDLPKPVPPPDPPAVPKIQNLRECPAAKRSLLSTAQKRTLTMQMSAYRKINRWLAVEIDKIRNDALYNHTVRQLQQQDFLALQQQRYNQQQAHQHSLHSRVSRDPRIDSKHQQQHQQRTINNEKRDAVPREQNNKSSQSPPRLQLVQSNLSDKTTINKTGAISMHQALQQLIMMQLPISNCNKSTRKTPLKQKHDTSIVESSPNTGLQNDESKKKENQHDGAADKSSITVDTTTKDQIDNSPESTSNKIEDLLESPTADAQSMHDILTSDNNSSQADEQNNFTPSISFRGNKREQSIMNGIGNVNVNTDEQNNFIDTECLEESQIKIEPHIHTVDIKQKTIKMELPFLEEKEAEKHCYGTKNDSYDSAAALSSAKVPTECCAIPNIKIENNSPENVDKINDSISNDECRKTIINSRNNQSCVPELIDLNDSSDDDSDCISMVSSDRETIILSRDIETRDRLEYNQSSIDEELECEALSKKLGIRCPSSNQDCSYIKTEIPIISDVMTIDKNTYDNLDEEAKNNLHDDIIDITDMNLKFEHNIASLRNANFETTVIDFNGESIEGLEHRPNCANCNNKRGTVICECGEVSYCSDKCLEAHWPESHANVCSGPTININSIAEIILDDD